MPRGSRHTLSPRQVTFNRTRNGRTETVTSTVHVAPEDQPSNDRSRNSSDSSSQHSSSNSSDSSSQHSSSNSSDSNSGRVQTPPELPAGFKYTAFTSDRGKANLKSFIERSYGAEEGRSFHFPKNSKFYGIVGPDRKIKAAGEVHRMNWAMSEVRHITTDPDMRQQGMGKNMLSFLDNKITTPTAMLTTKLPTIKRIAEDIGYEKQQDTQGPSGDSISIYIKNM